MEISICITFKYELIISNDVLRYGTQKFHSIKRMKNECVAVGTTYTLHEYIYQLSKLINNCNASHSIQISITY